MLTSRNEALRVAFIHVEENAGASKEFYSKLVKADAHGKDQVCNYFQILLGAVFCIHALEYILG